MFEILLSISTAYLIGLAVFGYVCVLGLLQFECKRRKVGSLITNFLMAIHFCFGITGVLVVPSFLYGKFKANLPSEISVSFAIAEFVALGLVFIAVRMLNRYENLRNYRSTDTS